MADLADPQPVLDDNDRQYHARDALATASRSTLMTGGAGLLVASVQNTLQRRNVGAFGVFTRFGTTVGTFAAMGAAFSFVSTASANLREKEDLYNEFLGGFTAGMIRGMTKRSAASTIGNGLFLGVALAAVQYAGGTLLGYQNVPEAEGRWPTKEEIRKRFRRPYQETINEIGEGRGIYGPGYEERRKQRLKDNYGIDVPEPYYKASPSS